MCKVSGFHIVVAEDWYSAIIILYLWFKYFSVF